MFLYLFFVRACNVIMTSHDLKTGRAYAGTYIDTISEDTVLQA